MLRYRFEVAFQVTSFSEWIASCNDFLSIKISIGVSVVLNLGYNSFSKTEK